MQAWIRFRLVYDLRADVEWVVAVARDPTAITNYGTPLLPAEVTRLLQDQASADSLVAPARRYGTEFPADFVGVWIEGPLVVLGFADHVAEHQAEVAALFGEKVVVREVRYSPHQLREFEDAIEEARGPHSDRCFSVLVGPPGEQSSCPESPIDWFETVGIDVISVSIDEMENVIRIDYRAASPGVEKLIRDRFDAGDWLVLTWEGPLPWTGPYGRLEVTLVDDRGKRVGFSMVIQALDPRLQGRGPFLAPDGRSIETFPAAPWRVEITYIRDGEEATVARDVTIRPDDLLKLRVLVD